MLGVIDYGRGNLHSVLKALGHVGGGGHVVRRPQELERCRAAILPGVGAFGDAMERLRLAGMERALTEFAASGRPLLGICVGMQVMLSVGTEGGTIGGLGLVAGNVEMLAPADGIKIPHTGWNQVGLLRPSALMEGVADGSHFYFVHSFAAFPEHRSEWLGETTHGTPFASVIGRGNVYGVQFHPEKSGRVGLRLLSNFVSLLGGYHRC